MNKNDIIFSVICGLAVAWIANDFFKKYFWIFIFALPALSIIGLWLVEIIGKKLLFVRQAGKYALAGAFADVVDIKVFQFLFLFIPIPLLLKTFSFIVATFIKYLLNKHWAFEKPEKDGINKEIAQFFMVAAVGLLLNVISFYYFNNIKTAVSATLWTELSIILAALVAATWNFLGFKFFVFKK